MKKKYGTNFRSRLKEGKRTLLVSNEAYTKFVVLHNNTSIEWSGYGPVLHDGNGNYELKDFYYLSTDDDWAETNLSAEATAQAWMNVVKDGYDLEGLTLAWVHCHPGGMNFWSATDDGAIKDLTARNGKGIDQVSVLFYGSVIARIDTLDKPGESMKVSIDYGKYADDIARASKVETGAYKRREEQNARTCFIGGVLPGYEHLYPELDLPALTAPWYVDEQEDEESTTWIFRCDLCLEQVSQTKKPLICRMCGGKVCERCEDAKYELLCVVDANGLEMIEEHAREGGPCGVCYLCESDTEKGELYCEQCKPIFQNVAD